uniref:P-type Ca(2+) transporter n=1 Tax=Acyrthosiphon pisum TaxID=7029 RepID=A0A8R2H8G7_ACYPI|eukprot:XP_016664696.1 PREDICTED: magnesium-transporting ATPase, P-type 1-like [Acyrthosiphon pisum]
MTDMKLNQEKKSWSNARPQRQKTPRYLIEDEAGFTADETLVRLRSDALGLSEREAEARLEVYGRNQVAHDKAPHALIQLIQAFNNPFIYVLMALAAVSFFTDYLLPLRKGEETDLTGVIIIVTMVTLSGLLRFWQEFRTNKAAQALKSMVRTTATVLRRESAQQPPARQEVDIATLVPGDIIYLSAGDLVPADVRLLDSRDLFISQAILTEPCCTAGAADYGVCDDCRHLLPFSPLGHMVGLTPLPWAYFPWLVATLLGYCVVAQGMKMLYIKRFGQWF